MSQHSSASSSFSLSTSLSLRFGRHRIASALALSLVVASLTGCQTSKTVAKEDLVGQWDRGGVYVQFNADDTFRVARAADQLSSTPVDMGTFRIDGTEFSFISDDDSGICPGQTGLYEVQWVEEGALQFTFIEDPCLVRGTTLGGGPVRPLDP